MLFACDKGMFDTEQMRLLANVVSYFPPGECNNGIEFRLRFVYDETTNTIIELKDRRIQHEQWQRLFWQKKEKEFGDWRVDSKEETSLIDMCNLLVSAGEGKLAKELHDELVDANKQGEKQWKL